MYCNNEDIANDIIVNASKAQKKTMVQKWINKNMTDEFKQAYAFTAEKQAQIIDGTNKTMMIQKYDKEFTSFDAYNKAYAELMFKNLNNPVVQVQLQIEEGEKPKLEWAGVKGGIGALFTHDMQLTEAAVENPLAMLEKMTEKYGVIAPLFFDSGEGYGLNNKGLRLKMFDIDYDQNKRYFAADDLTDMNLGATIHLDYENPFLPYSMEDTVVSIKQNYAAQTAQFQAAQQAKAAQQEATTQKSEELEDKAA